MLRYMSKKIPQSVIDLLHPEKDYSYVEYLGSQNNKVYYILSYYDNETITVGFPMVALWENEIVSLVDVDEVFYLIGLFVKE